MDKKRAYQSDTNNHGMLNLLFSASCEAAAVAIAVVVAVAAVVFVAFIVCPRCNLLTAADIPCSFIPRGKTLYINKY